MTANETLSFVEKKAKFRISKKFSAKKKISSLRGTKNSNFRGPKTSGRWRTERSKTALTFNRGGWLQCKRGGCGYGFESRSKIVRDGSIRIFESVSKNFSHSWNRIFESVSKNFSHLWIRMSQSVSKILNNLQISWIFSIWVHILQSVCKTACNPLMESVCSIPPKIPAVRESVCSNPYPKTLAISKFIGN